MNIHILNLTLEEEIEMFKKDEFLSFIEMSAEEKTAFIHGFSTAKRYLTQI